MYAQTISYSHIPCKPLDLLKFWPAMYQSCKSTEFTRDIQQKTIVMSPKCDKKY